MTHLEVAQMVESIGLPFAYYQFDEGTAEPAPFIVYFYAMTDDLMADNTNYQRIDTLNIELYTDFKDFELEKTVEDVLKENNLTYYKEESFIDSEKLWQIAYEMEVIINE